MDDLLKTAEMHNVQLRTDPGAIGLAGMGRSCMRNTAMSPDSKELCHLQASHIDVFCTCACRLA